MDGVVRVTILKGLGVVTLRAPPVNALSAPVRQALADALAMLAADQGAKAIALIGEGPMFSAGADLREQGDDAAAPSLSRLCEAIEGCAKPVIAVLQGPALGGGAEVALAAHWRLAVPAATLGLPELALGLGPGAGATQRLPRLAGAPLALDLLLSGRPIGAEEARRAGLVDGVVTGDPLLGAMAFAQALLARDAGLRPTLARRERLADAAGWLRATAEARAALAPADLPARGVVDCLEAALLLPPAQGLAYEAARREECEARPEARALRHLFLAERRAPATLLRRGGAGGRELTDLGEALVDRLGRAMGHAAGALARLGERREVIDAALVDWGMPAGPFGGEAGGAGEAGQAIVRRINAAVAAEGARLIAEGEAPGPDDVDALAVMGLGVPRLSGGPMRAAETHGLAGLARDMAQWERDDPVWSPPALFLAAARGTGGFAAATRAA